HELWRGPDDRSYYRPADPKTPLLGVPAALALADAAAPLPPLAVAPYDSTPAAVEERSPGMLLQALAGVFRVVRRRPPALAKSTGAIRKPELRAVAREVGAAEDWAEFLCSLAAAAGILQAGRERISANPGAEAFFRQPVVEQLRALHHGWLHL